MAEGKNKFRQFYAPHHFVFYPLILFFLAATIYHTVTVQSHTWLMMAVILLFIGALSFMMRQHYALTLQDRIIRLEMRHKYFVLTGKDFEPLEAKLSFKQIASLRYASDEELPGLIDRAINENLAPEDIRKAIVNWKSDHNRV